MKTLLSILFVTFSMTFSIANPDPPSVELLAGESFTPDYVRLLNISNMGDSVEVVLEVVTTGAIQQRMGGLKSGGRESQTFKGTFAYVIDQNNEILSKDYRWLEPEGARGKFDFITQAQTDAQSISEAKVFATEKDALRGYEYRKFQRMKIEDKTEVHSGTVTDSMIRATYEDIRMQLEDILDPTKTWKSKKEKEKKKEEAKVDDLPETIYSVDPVISIFSGKLKKLRSGTFTKQADGKRSLLTGRYERKEYDTYDIEMEDIFDNEDKRLTAVHHVIEDPLTGKVIIYAGVKVRKDKDRENNKYFEHLILTLDHKGNILNKVTLENEDAWEVGTNGMIGKRKISQFAGTTFDKIYISQYQPSKKFNEGADLERRRMLLINKEGEVEYKAEFECAIGFGVGLQRVVEIGDLILANYYLAWPDKHFAGIYTFNQEEGLVDDIRLYWDQGAKIIPTEHNKDIMNILHYLAEDSSRVLIDLFYHKKEEDGTVDNPGQAARYYNYYMYRISPDGTLSDATIIDRKSDNYTDMMELEGIGETEDDFIFKLEETYDRRNFVRILTIDKNDLSVQEYSPPHPLMGDNAFYLDEDSNRMYLVVQDEDDRVLLIQK